jgi:hypothetical protein
MKSIKKQLGKSYLMGISFVLFVLFVSSCKKKEREPRYSQEWANRVDRPYQEPQSKQQTKHYSSYQQPYPQPEGSYQGANADLQMLMEMSGEHTNFLAPTDPPYIQDMLWRCHQGDGNACNIVNNYRYQMAAQYGNAIQQMDAQRRR